MITLGTTFSGIGSPEISLKNLKIPHTVKWACDIDAKVKLTYVANHVCQKWYDDITKINVDELEYVDLYVFGFPCVDCSINGKRDLSKGRTVLVNYSINIINKIKPKYFVFENVKGILSNRFRDFFDYIIDELSKEYNLNYEVLNSKNFGVPQSRERLFCIGIRKDIDKQFKFPAGEETKLRLKDIYEPNSKTIPEDHKFYILPYVETKNYRQYKRGAKENRSQTDRVYYPTSICPSLRANEGGGPFFLLENNKIKRLSVLERKRLQGFPEDFQFPVKEREAWKQLGNSITVNVLEAIFKNLL